MTRRGHSEAASRAVAVAGGEAFGEVLPLLERALDSAAGRADVYPALTLTVGDPIEVLVRVDRWAVHVELPTLEWHGHTPVLVGERRRSFALGDLRWLPPQQELGSAVAAVRAERLALFRRCSECGETNPPEWMHDEALCSGCAERNHGIVY